MVNILNDAKLEDILAQVKYTPKQVHILEQSETALTEFLHSTYGGKGTMTGSTSRKTALMNKYGLPSDYDIELPDSEQSVEAIANTYQTNKHLLENALSKIYGKKVVTELYDQKEIPDAFKQLRVSITDQKGNEVSSIDVNFGGKDGASKYTQTFFNMVESQTAKLGKHDAKEAKDYFLANIRAAKHLLEQEKAYEKKDGSFGGLGTELLFLTIPGEKAQTLDEFKERFSVGNAMNYLSSQGKELILTHPLSGDNIAEKVTSWNHLVATAKKHSGMVYAQKQTPHYTQTTSLRNPLRELMALAA